MAEVKNAFIKSKMNKDLDSRLLPSGEYRNALNAQVSKSEGSDVGALENVLGNELLTNFGLSVSNLSSIGYYSDEVNSIIYVFLTDNDTSSYVPAAAVGPAPAGSNHYVISYDASINTSTVLVTGAFLNFSKLNPIFGVNLIEDLLFWTDNRNQPRKINITSAVTTGYYSTEDNISVAKYNPYQSIELYRVSDFLPGDFTVRYETTMKDVFNIAYPDGGTTKVDGTQTGTTINITDTDILITGTPTGGQVVKKVNVLGQPVDFNPQVTVSTSSTSTSTTLYVNSSITVNNGETLVFDANPYYIPNYKGDPKFLEDKFVRFSYRFKFNDGEYSILAPFTQPCFIPKQDGYFLNNTSTEGDEEQAFSSTIVDFMENKVNKIDLKIPLPSTVANLNSDLHIEEIDIVYKESDGLAVQVVESIPYANNNFGASSADSLLDVFTYEYESQIPYKTLPSEEITRVYDKVPVKALSQEIISNRIVYGNYQDKHTPPAFLSYNVSSSIKEDFNLNTGEADVNTASGSYPKGTSIAIDNASGTIIVGSLVTSLYPTDVIPAGTKVVTTDGSTTMTLSEDVELAENITISFNLSTKDSNTTSIVEYPSSSLKTNRNYQVGFVLSDKFGRQSTVILSKNEQTAISVSNSTVFAPYEESNPIEWIGNSLKVSVNDPIGTSPNAALNEPGVYNGDVTDEDYNPLGWYSYKVVVKQVEQDYYNVYSAGAMKGLPYNYDTNNITPVLSENTSFITLLNDNINKIPRDLSEVGPQDKTFRSSVELYGRVQNTLTSNEQFYPGRRSFTTSSVEDLFGLFDVQDFKGRFDEAIPITNPLNAFHGFFKSDSDPFIAEISTSQNSGLQFGVNNSYTAVAGSGDASNNGTSVPTVTLNGTTVTGSINTGSLLLSINGNVVDGVYVVSVTTDTNPIVTFNQNVSYSPSNTFVFSQQDFNDINTLAVFETKPVTSRLDIFWETSSSGLITDLNDIILYSSDAGAGFSSWNDSAFQENITLNSNILSQDFVLVDNFGNQVTLAAGDDFYISSILDNETPTPTNAFNWFELYEPSGANNGYNIRVTQDFVDNVYFSATSGSNDFNFSFISSIGGATTNYNQVANLTNIPPVMIGPLGPDEQDPAVSYSTLASTAPSLIDNFTATNGANPLGGNQGRNIIWSVTATKDGIDASSYFGVSAGGTNEISSCSLSNVATNGAPTGIYDIKLRCTDAGGAFQEITITAQLGVVPVRVTDYILKYNNGTIENPSFNFSPVCLIEVANAPDPGSTNGFYAINGSWNTISNGVTTIDLKQIDSGTGGTWFYGTTKTAALNQWRSSFTNDFPRSFSADSATTSAAVSNSATIPLDNINGRLQTGLIVSGVGISAGTTVSSISQAGDGNTVGSITVNANQTIADNVNIRIGDIPSSVYLTYGFEVIT
jgi:hypothetical protein